MNKHIAAKVIACSVILLTLMAGFAFAMPSELEHLIKLNNNAVNKFRIEKDDKRKSISIYGGLTKPYPGKHEEAARSFMKEYHSLLKLSDDLSELRLQDIRESKRFKTVTLSFEQVYHDIPVYFSGVTIELDDGNRVRMASVSLKYIDNLNTTPVIKPDELQGIISQSKPELEPLSKVKLIITFIDDEPVLCYSAWSKIGDDPYYMIIDTSTGEFIKFMYTGIN